MPNSKPITELERREIEESVWNAVCAACQDPKLRRRLNKFALSVGYTEDQFMADNLLDQFVFGPRLPLHDQQVKPVVLSAVDRNDTRFFIQFGKVLARKPKPHPKVIGDIKIPLIRMLEQFLIGNWTIPSGILPELFYLTPESLAEVSSHFFGKELFPEAIVKLRQRLGLKPFRRGKVRVISVNGKLKFVQPDRKA